MVIGRKSVTMYKALIVEARDATGIVAVRLSGTYYADEETAKTKYGARFIKLVEDSITIDVGEEL